MRIQARRSPSTRRARSGSIRVKRFAPAAIASGEGNAEKGSQETPANTKSEAVASTPDEKIASFNLNSDFFSRHASGIACSSRAMVIGRTSKRSKRRSARTSTTQCWLNSTYTIRRTSGGTARRSASARCRPSSLGRPDPEHIPTRYVERQNWTVRTSMRRYTRLLNGFSRKIENHMPAVAINYFTYNFIDVADLGKLLIESESKRAA